MLEMNQFAVEKSEILMKTVSQKITTSDGIEFTVSTNDVVDLTEQQFNNLAATVLRRKAAYIRKDGVDIASLTKEQVDTVISEIYKRISGSEDPFKDDLIRISDHIIDDHASKPETLKKRGWYRDEIQEVYDDIINVIKEVYNVRKAIVKFHKSKGETLPKFTFTIIGIKVNGEEGEVSIAFIEDSTDFVLAVTII
jgi:Glu-tRNA(Gln) amidotransferase subunit E-like FAD-binding protein